MRKLISKKTAAIIAVIKKIIIFVIRGLINTSVCPTSVNHHQSVIKATIAENEKKRRKIAAIPIPEKSLEIFIS
jgi:hypothetical protein